MYDVTTKRLGTHDACTAKVSHKDDMATVYISGEVQTEKSHNLHKALLFLNQFLHICWCSCGFSGDFKGANLPDFQTSRFTWRVQGTEAWLQLSILHKQALVLHPLRDTSQISVPPWQQGKVLIKPYDIGCAPKNIKQQPVCFVESCLVPRLFAALSLELQFFTG